MWPVDPLLGSVYEWLGWGCEGGEEVEGGGGRGKLERVGLVVGLGVASLKRARGLCSFLAVLKIASPLSSSIVLLPLCLYRHSIDVQLYGVT